MYVLDMSGHGGHLCKDLCMVVVYLWIYASLSTCSRFMYLHWIVLESGCKCVFVRVDACLYVTLSLARVEGDRGACLRAV